MNPLRIVFVALGFLFCGLGAIGVFVPVLPTVPFLLLASFFFAKGSKRFTLWFESTKLYQDNLESYLRHRSMTRKTKLKILTLATLMMGVSAIFVPSIAAKVFLIAFILIMHYYFARHIKTITPEEQATIRADDLTKRKAQASEESAMSLHETVSDIKEMHDEIFEDALTPKELSSAGSQNSSSLKP